ncbi:MAG: hypothetical protein OSA98_02035 [Rubripirellula sp.]|nr:hypothetical protein [Rubripirellula sp.]
MVDSVTYYRSPWPNHVQRSLVQQVVLHPLLGRLMEYWASNRTKKAAFPIA